MSQLESRSNLLGAGEEQVVADVDGGLAKDMPANPSPVPNKAVLT